MATFLTLNLVHTLPPSAPNRDRNGRPKAASYGGVERARLSSQTLKRAIRRSEAFRKAFEGQDLLGVRTRELGRLLTDDLRYFGAEEPEIDAILMRMAALARKGGEVPEDEADEAAEATENDDVPGQASAPVFLAPNEIRPLAKQLLDLYRAAIESGKKNARASVDLQRNLTAMAPRSVDVALFGRFSTSSAVGTVNGALLVAQALGTHANRVEVDFFTTTDDLSVSTIMLGDREFTGTTYHLFYSINWEELVANLAGDREMALRTVRAFMDGAVRASLPGGQHTYAHSTLPEFGLIEISRGDAGRNLGSAFGQPVREFNGSGMGASSVMRLVAHITELDRAYGAPLWCASFGPWAPIFGADLRPAPFDRVLELLEAQLKGM